MVVRKKKKPARRQRSLANTGTNEITVAQHGMAWKMWIAGVDPRDVQRECRLTGRQWAWLFRTGDPEGGMPSFESMWTEEVTRIRSQAVESAKEIGARSPEVIRLRMENAKDAGGLLSLALREWAAAAQEKGKTFANTAPNEDAIRAMKVLKDISDGKAAAEMFRAIYSDGPGMRAVDPTADHKGSDPMARVSDPESNEAAPTEITDGFWRDWQKMTPEQREAYIESGDDPDPKDMIDVEAKVTQ